MPDKPIHMAGFGPYFYDWIGDTMADKDEIKSDTDTCDCVTNICRHNYMDERPNEGPTSPPDPFGPVVFIRVVDMRLIGLAVCLGYAIGAVIFGGNHGR